MLKSALPVRFLMLSKNDENNKVVLATLTLMLLSLSVASSISISAPHYASAQEVTGQGGYNATNATMTSTGNATNTTMTGASNATNVTATGAGGGNMTTSISIVSGSSTLTDTAFQPNPVQVSIGATITWTNNDSQPHTVTSGQNGQPDGRFDSSPNFNPLMAPGQTFSHTFTQAGEYPYYCALHPNMVGTATVT